MTPQQQADLTWLEKQVAKKAISKRRYHLLREKILEKTKEEKSKI